MTHPLPQMLVSGENESSNTLRVDAYFLEKLRKKGRSSRRGLHKKQDSRYDSSDLNRSANPSLQGNDKSRRTPKDLKGKKTPTSKKKKL